VTSPAGVLRVWSVIFMSRFEDWVFMLREIRKTILGQYFFLFLTSTVFSISRKLANALFLYYIYVPITVKIIYNYKVGSKYVNSKPNSLHFLAMYPKHPIM